MIPNLDLPDVKHIVRLDEIDFYHVLSNAAVDLSRFENHWPYIIQATRGRGFVYKKNKTRIYFYFREVPKSMELVIVNLFGKEISTGLELLQSYAQFNKIVNRIKNISFEDLETWKQSGYVALTPKFVQVL